MADNISSLTSSLTSGSIHFTGLGSGTDFESMIDKLMEAEKIRTKRLELWRSEWETKSEEFDKLSRAMLDLHTTLQGMNTPDEFLVKQVTVSNPMALTATANSMAEEATHDLEIVSLATNDMHMGSAIFSSPEDKITAAPGTFSFVYGNRQISIDVNADTTLSQFVSLINANAGNRNYVRASIINDGSGYRLQLRGMDLGAGNNILIDDGLTTLDAFKANQFVQTQQASNAQLKVDGWPNVPEARAMILKASTTYDTITETITTTSETLKMAYAGQIHSITVAANSSVQDLIDSINTEVGFAMASTIINDEGKVELLLTGEAGSANQISIVNTPGTTLGQFQSTAFTRIQGATDGYIERPTNSISDLIPGVTMNLTKAGESVTLAASVDTAGVTENVRTFVNKINEVLKLIQDQTKVDTVGKNVTGAILTGNYGVQMIQQRLKGILAQSGLGFDYHLDPLTSLGSVGITTDTSQGSLTFGLLVFDESVFASALANDPDAVARLFSADYYPSTREIVNGQAVESSNFRFDSFVRGVTGAGDFKVAYSIEGGVIVASPPPTINGYPAHIEGNKITAMGDNNPARGLSIEILNLADGTFSGHAQIKSGKTEELSAAIKTLTDPQSGTLEILKNNYQDIMDAIDDKIAYEERRLTQLERTMRLRFANLEALLGKYDGLAKQLESQIKGLSSKSS